jgi:uncharacterized RDD family membrane protein YckC
MPTPPSAAAASSAISAGPSPSRAEPAPTEETGPVFLDEDVDGVGAGGQVPAARSGDSLEVRPRGEVARADSIDWDDPGRLHGRRPEPASAWQADASWQTGFAGQSEERVSWGRAEGGGETGPSAEEGPAADPRGGWGQPVDEGRTDSAAGAQTAGSTASGSGFGAAPEAAQPPPEGTFQMRAMSAEDLRNAARETGSQGGGQVPEHTVGLRRSDVFKLGPGGQGAAPSAPVVPGQGSPAQPQTPGQGAADRTPPAQPPSAQQAPPAQQPPAQQAPPSQVPPAQVPPAQGGFGQSAPPQSAQQAQPAWAQHVQDLAGRGQPASPEAYGANASGAGAAAQPIGAPEAVTPWRPPPSDPFLQASQQEARPAGLGKRLGARLIDGVLTSAVAVGVAFPFAGQAVDHVEQKLEAARQSGETKQVWLIDGTTGGYLGIVLGALIVFGLLYEVLPTSRWGRTLGKKIFGLKVLTMEQQDRPGFRSAFVRWLTYGGLSVLVIGVVNVLWCVFDRPWRQCWHDKIAGTFVSRDSGEIRL